mgnify:CR=1 FL=1|tara:strand:- start:38516 stop:38947 length:432 start_codon:yes stop_codon:yes gene_type:complete
MEVQIRKIDSASCIILNTKNEVLLQKKDLGYFWFPGKWCLFGGGMKNGETPEQTLIRELKNEIECEFDCFEFFCEQDYKDEYDEEVRQGKHYFYSTEFSGKPSKISINEGGGFAFFSKSELDSVPIVEHDKKVIKQYFESKRL